jgi:putative ABC transport system permease protein
MFQFSFKTFWRRARKNKSYFFINMLGLTVGITSTLLIFTWINSELSYDQHQPDAGRIYRVYSDIKMNGHDFTSSMAPPPLMSVLNSQLPEAEGCTRVWTYYNIRVTNKEEGLAEKAFNEKRVIQADSNFFDVFNYKLLAGDAKTALLEPLTIVVTKDAAIKYFGQEAVEKGQVLGSKLTLTFDGWDVGCKITGISQNTPESTHMPYDIIFSNISDPWNRSNDWIDNTYYTYLKLKQGADPQIAEAKIPSIVKPYLKPQLEKSLTRNYEEMGKNGNYWKYKLQPITDIHLYSTFDREIQPNGNISHLWILGLAALFILLVACINYANLSTANSIERSKEVGVKKTLGFSTNNLRVQFFVESMVMSLLSMAVSVLLVKLLLVPFAEFMQTSLSLNFFGAGFSWLLILIIFVTVAFLGGVYPALHISSFHAIDALKGKVRLSRGFFNFRKTLITAQFAICIGLLIGALVVYWQLDYFLNKASGFEKDSVLVLADPSQKLGEKVQPLIEELQKQSAVNIASISSDYPGSGGYLLPFSVRNRNENTEHVMTSFSAGFNFLQTFNIELLQGRDFRKELDDKISDRIIINEAARRMLQLEQPLGKRIVTRDLNDLRQQNHEFEIIGVVKNFNFESLHREIKPMAISLNKKGAFISVRMSSKDLRQSIAAIESIWKRFGPAVPFEYSFLNDQIGRLYRTEMVLSRLLTILTTLIIFIASLGLFGLTLLLFQQRTKEVGIRKVLGASANSIAVLLSKDFFKLIAVAFVIASPLAWWAMHQWLQGFAYRIDVAWWMFLIAALVVLLIAFITISFQVVKAARTNPVESLRLE